MTQQHGYFHAGATSAIADSAGGYAAFTLFPENTSVLTVEYKINFLAPAVGDHIEAVGTVLKSGRTLTVCQLEVFGVQRRQRSVLRQARDVDLREMTKALTAAGNTRRRVSLGGEGRANAGSPCRP